METTDKKRFFDKVKKQEQGCWTWLASKNANGYGQFSYKGKPKLAHRISYQMHFGDPEGFFVCHKCDKPSCVNPDHLFLGGPSDNVSDMVLKNRHSGVLTDKDVEEIRQSDKSLEFWAKKLGVATTTISAARSGATFKHVSAKPRRGNKTGEQNHSAKLRSSDVNEIYSSNEKSSELAKKYNVCTATINRIKRGASRFDDVQKNLRDSADA